MCGYDVYLMSDKRIKTTRQCHQRKALFKLLSHRLQMVLLCVTVQVGCFCYKSSIPRKKKRKIWSLISHILTVTTWKWTKVRPLPFPDMPKRNKAEKWKMKLWQHWVTYRVEGRTKDRRHRIRGRDGWKQLKQLWENNTFLPTLCSKTEGLWTYHISIITS